MCALLGIIICANFDVFVHVKNILLSGRCYID